LTTNLNAETGWRSKVAAEEPDLVQVIGWGIAVDLFFILMVAFIAE
jgi:hypothetical protein